MLNKTDALLGLIMLHSEKNKIAIQQRTNLV
jgi:hypothetical protein